MHPAVSCCRIGIAGVPSAAGGDPQLKLTGKVPPQSPLKIVKILCLMNDPGPHRREVRVRECTVTGDNLIGQYTGIQEISVAGIQGHVIHKPDVIVAWGKRMVQRRESGFPVHKTGGGSHRTSRIEILGGGGIQLNTSGGEVRIRGVERIERDLVKGKGPGISVYLQIGPQHWDIGGSGWNSQNGCVITLHILHIELLDAGLPDTDTVHATAESPPCLTFKGHIIIFRRIGKIQDLFFPFVDGIEELPDQHPGIGVRNFIVDPEDIPTR